jgi:hypothetical protein
MNLPIPRFEGTTIGNASLAQSAIASLPVDHRYGGRTEPPDALAPTDDGADTNSSTQNGLTAIAVLELCADALPTAAPTGSARSRSQKLTIEQDS